ncbi:hypothetical protein WJX84_000533 [Apatococcus fuscideae]|uniref:Mitochondrial glycoprotein n=1 Tax=Apatococcus fuscideae TaxID=2026836 RepID=A0AAW1S9D5_9CHLO
MLCKSVASTGVAALGRTGRQCPLAVSKAAGFVRQQQSLASRCETQARPQLRAFASSPLADVLKSELDFELENDEKPEGLSNGPPKPFQLTESPGDTHLLLKREYKGEQIEITTSVNDQPEAPEIPEGEEGEEAEADSFPGLDFEVAIIKGDQRLAFMCQSNGAYLEVIHVSSVDPAGAPPSLRTFQGPVYQELDDDLQAEFANYLHERGIDEKLGDYLITLVNEKEQEEYKRWLGNVRNFVTK